MKGISDITWAIITLIVVVVFILMGVLISMQISLPFFSTADPISYSIEFEHAASQPFILSEVLSHVSIGDRPLLEQSIETVASGEVSQGLPEGLASFIDKYKLKDYSVSIRKGGKELMR